ncbi:toxin-antitoxin system YwqK family antitoxin [Halpernia frigidisoli]|uniref:Antitoxin component YwqK of the YwqJK toxin-antitoxin module n=1 Tax=Halpernia frigidisoli TaxID=1125876 RepID=A0A1I3D752_9FLAO|nr:toxin-antitoxin system YwqK family antitoxin [Halpernia frigidisoli]SFH82487.1 Antitoxin component YwqK of the YwqJK toxin-antitoxin module [Halpernia frigidisoli]
MKIFRYFILFLLFISCSKNSAEKDIVIKKIPKIYKNANDENLKLKNDTLFVNHQLFSGFLYRLDENRNDTLSFESYYEGLQSGVSKKWFGNKNLMEMRFYFKGKKEGKQIAFWENGYKRFEFLAKNDIYEDEMKEWNNLGKLIHLATYKNGQEEGPQKLWYDNGKIRANYVIISGKRYGLLGTKNCKNVSDSVFTVR